MERAENRCPIWLYDCCAGQWKWMEEVPRRTSLAPLASPCFVLCLLRVEPEGLLDVPGKGGDHCHCTAEPPPGHTRLGWHVCRTKFARKLFFELRNLSRKMLRNFPRIFEPLLGGSKKSREIPSKSPAKLPSPKIKKKITDELLQDRREKYFGNGPNTVSESMVSKHRTQWFFHSHRLPGRELSEFLSAYYVCAKANSPSLSQNSSSLAKNPVSPIFQNSTLETVFCPFPKSRARTNRELRGWQRRGCLDRCQERPEKGA